VSSRINCDNPIEISVGLMLLFSSIVWLLSYQVGLFLNLRHTKISQELVEMAEERCPAMYSMSHVIKVNAQIK